MVPSGRLIAARSRLVSGSTSSGVVDLDSFRIRSEPTQMATLIARTRRLALTIGPLVAIALSLAAGHKW